MKTLSNALFALLFLTLPLPSQSAEPAPRPVVKKKSSSKKVVKKKVAPAAPAAAEERQPRVSKKKSASPALHAARVAMAAAAAAEAAPARKKTPGKKKKITKKSKKKSVGRPAELEEKADDERKHAEEKHEHQTAVPVTELSDANRQLLKAIGDNDSAAVRAALAAGADPFVRIREGSHTFTPAMLAVHDGHVEIAHILNPTENFSPADRETLGADYNRLLKNTRNNITYTYGDLFPRDKELIHDQLAHLDAQLEKERGLTEKFHILNQTNANLRKMDDEAEAEKLKAAAYHPAAHGHHAPPPPPAHGRPAGAHAAPAHHPVPAPRHEHGHRAAASAGITYTESNLPPAPHSILFDELSGLGQEPNIHNIQKALAAGADPNTRFRPAPEILFTPLVFAITRGRQDIVSLLEKHGAVMPPDGQKTLDMLYNETRDTVYSKNHAVFYQDQHLLKEQKDQLDADLKNAGSQTERFNILHHRMNTLREMSAQMYAPVHEAGVGGPEGHEHDTKHRAAGHAAPPAPHMLSKVGVAPEYLQKPSDDDIAAFLKRIGPVLSNQTMGEVAKDPFWGKLTPPNGHPSFSQQYGRALTHDNYIVHTGSNTSENKKKIRLAFDALIHRSRREFIGNNGFTAIGTILRALDDIPAIQFFMNAALQLKDHPDLNLDDII